MKRREPKNPARPRGGWGIHSLFCLGLSLIVQRQATAGGITLDQSGTKLNGANIDIGQNLGKAKGGNLLHSFRTFNVEAGQSVNFSGDAKVRNIIARVTGDGSSNIQGRLSSSIDGANLFLINPNGVFISNGASIDVSGVFHATTADYLDLGGNEGRIYASDANGTTVLTSDAVSAFGFTSKSPKPIKLDGATLNSPGHRVVLVGGAISIINGASVSGGLDVVSAGGPGTVSFKNGLVQKPDAMTLGTIEISGSSINANDSSFTPRQISFVGGNMIVRGSTITSSNFTSPKAPSIDFNIVDTLGFLPGAQLSSSGSGEAGINGATIRISAKNLKLNGEVSKPATILTNASGMASGGSVSIHLSGLLSIGFNGSILSEVSENSAAIGGLIDIKTTRLSVNGNFSDSMNFSGIRSSNKAPVSDSSSGDIRINTSGLLKLVNHGAIESVTSGAATSGDIRVRAGSLYLDQATNGQPLDPRDVATGFKIRPDAGSTGGGGILDIKVDGIATILRGARVDSSAYGEGDGGAIRFTADRLLIRGENFPSGIFSFSDPDKTTADGSAGNINVSVNHSIVLNRSGLIDSSSFGRGQAGSVTVTGGNITIDRKHDGLFTGIGSDTELDAGGGDAGDVTVIARDSLVIRGGGLVSAATFGSGHAGSVSVTSGNIVIEGKGSTDETVVTHRSGIVAITGECSSGNGGQVSVTVTDGNLDIRDGALIGAKSLGAGRSGDVEVNVSGSLSQSAGATIEASTEENKRAGLVDVFAGSVDLSANSLISSNANGTGKAGGVRLKTGTLLLANSQIGVRAADADAGKLAIISDNDVTLVDSRLTAAAGGAGDGGSIKIDALGSLTIQQGGVVEARTAGKGTAGGIRISAHDLFIHDGSLLADSNGDGGSVNIRFTDTLRAIESRIVAKAFRNGGNILIPGGSYTILDHSPMNANAIKGSGGNIFIGSDVFLANESPVTASSRFGAQGLVRIDPLVALSGSEGDSTPPPLDVSDVLQPECTQRLPTDTGSFIITGKGGTPRDPGGYLPSLRLFTIGE